MYIDPALFTGGDVIASINLAPLPENIIHLFPISELNTQMSVLNNKAASKSSTALLGNLFTINLLHASFNFPTILSTIVNRIKLEWSTLPGNQYDSELNKQFPSAVIFINFEGLKSLKLELTGISPLMQLVESNNFKSNSSHNSSVHYM